MCCRWNKTFVPLWGILIPGMRPCGWHGTTKVAIPFHSSAIFHPAPFVFHLQKQNCSPFSSCENMASQKALWGVSITRMGVLWLPQHSVSGLCLKTKTLDIRVIAPEITRVQAGNLICDRIASICAATVCPTLQIHGSDRWARVMQRPLSADAEPRDEAWGSGQCASTLVGEWN